MNIGIIGMGWGKRMHLPAFKKVDGLQVSAICAREKSQLEEIAEKFSVPTTYTNWADLINDKHINAISIVTPNYLHHPICLAAARKRKNILCEKPLALTYGQAKEMHKLVSDNDLVNMIAFPYRYVPSITKLKNMLDEGLIGSLFHINFNFFVRKNLKAKKDWHCEKNKTGTDSLANIGSHLIDLAMYLVGDFESICGQMGYFTRETDDVCNFIAYHKNQILGSYSISKVASSRKSNLQLSFNGSKGALICEININDNDLINYSLKHGRPLDTSFTSLDEGKIEGCKLYEEIGKNFLRYSSSQPYQGATFYDGLKTQEVIDAVIESIDKKKWIKI